MKAHEQELLLDITAAIASVRDKGNLFELIVEKIKPVFNPSGHAVVITVDKDFTYHQIFLSLLPGMEENAMRDFMKMKLPIDPVTKMILDADGPIILYLPPLWEQYPDVMGAQVTKSLGIMEIMASPLWNGGKKIGSFHLLSLTAGYFKKEQFPLFKAVIDIVAVAVANILANEATAIQQYQNQLLVDISSSIATVRNKNDLFQVILRKINPVFNCNEEAVILIINEEKDYYQLLLMQSKLHEEEIEYYKHARFPIDDYLRQMLEMDHAWLFPTAPYIEMDPNSAGSQVVQKLDVKEILTCRLMVGGKKIGCFSLLAEKTDHFNNEQLPLFKAIADIVAVAVSNILANEATETEQYYNNLLTSISASIATVKDKEDLFKIIFEKITPVFNHAPHAVVLPVDDDQKYYHMMFGEVTGLTKSEIEFYKTSRFDVLPPLRMILDAPQGLIIQSAPLIEKYRDTKAGEFNIKLGVQEVIGCRLQVSGKIIGAFLLLADRVDYFDKDQQSLFKAICDIVAVAVANIMAGEKVKLREYQQSQLLKISKHIAGVRDKDDLFHLVTKDLASFVNFDDAVISVVNEETQTISVFLEETCETTKKHPDYINAKTKTFPIVDGGMLSMLAASEKPKILDISMLHQHKPDLEFVRNAYNFGMREVIITRLMHGNKVIGMFSLLSKQKKQYNDQDVNAVQSLSSLVSIALNNILANEELKLREEQKTRLYNISTNIANVRDKNDLFRLVSEDVRKFISFDNAIIATIDEKQEAYSVFLSNVGISAGQQPDFHSTKSQSFPIVKDTIPFKTLHSNRPIIFDVKTEHFKKPEREFLKHIYDLGIRDCIATRLFHYGKAIGFFILFSNEAGRFTDSDASTMQSLCSLITIALRNILAIEEIENLSKQLERDNTYLNEEIKSSYNFEEIIGVSKPLQEVFKKVTQVAQADSTVLITGETGTGKELIARAIHNLSPRKARPLIKVNCAALPAALIESELFGHEKGSFTGATDKRIGKFELANGSTIFLDEVGELPLELQAKLLRAIQEKEIERLGGDRIIQVDVRIITATNRNLEKEVNAGKFRQDLFYRLNVYPIELPALRNRREDIPLLASHFIQKFSKKLGKKITGIAPEALEELVSNDWPGNIRELEHTIERSMLLTTGKSITSLYMDKSVVKEIVQPITNIGFQPRSLADNERDLIIETLKHTSGRIRGNGCAAELLDILPTTLEARMKKLGIKKEFVK